MFVALASGAVLSGCGGDSGNTGQGANNGGTSIGAAVIAFVAPRDGADTVIGGQLANFVQSVQSKLLDGCMTSDGFDAPPFGEIGPPNDLGNPQFPNLPAIKAQHDLGLFTGAGVSFFGPQRGMSAPERRAWQARIQHCFRTTSQQNPLFGSAKFGQLSSGWFRIVNQVSRSKRIRTLSKAAAACSAAHGVAATSVQSLYGRMQGQLGPISSSSANSEKVQAIQAKGASVLVACWPKVIDTTTAMLTSRQATYLAQNASAMTTFENQVNQQVGALERRYGVKLTLAGS